MGNSGQGELTPQEIFQLGLDTDHPDVDGIVISCTDLRAMEVIDALEKALDKPVISSNQALMFQAAQILDLQPRISGKLAFVESC